MPGIESLNMAIGSPLLPPSPASCRASSSEASDWRPSCNKLFRGRGGWAGDVEVFNCLSSLNVVMYLYVRVMSKSLRFQFFVILLFNFQKYMET